MTKHYNTTITEDASRIFNTKSTETIGNEVLPYITPTIAVTRFCDVIFDNVASNTTSTTIYTTPTDKDFYLVGAILSFVKDGTSTSTSSSITATIGGVSNKVILRLATLTLTAERGQISYNPSIPIKIDRGTNIAVTNSSGTANITARGVIHGYTVETTKGV